jgi:nitrogen regulatory protein P-II 1
LSVAQTTESKEEIMKFKYVVAIVPLEALESVERKLRSIHVGGMTLTKVMGFGEYKNFFANDWLSDHRKIEIFTEESKVELLLQTLLEAAHSDIPGAGIVAVMPVDEFLHLRTGSEARSARRSECLPSQRTRTSWSGPVTTRGVQT